MEEKRRKDDYQLQKEIHDAQKLDEKVKHDLKVEQEKLRVSWAKKQTRTVVTSKQRREREREPVLQHTVTPEFEDPTFREQKTVQISQ